ncbi:TIGR03557 family F420-dependent LLM class oxidoreductase [Methanolobus halotolerans]|uniref:LLM class F420-dependent oxidoreductase n=1 Tax=Methanolobus halotolerans TaxID=2052935 RepID=A0A4E0QU14_9EURY|nr:TIGR03557 family F420-dependent LLM class oxidoreductase [Methanolobus halotolerans]TGC11525.1 LLM class F420-dependent oxidoreductase [Methanolobus halotolerans]
MVKLGLKIAPEQYTPSEMLRQLVTAENNGFDTINVSDHFHPWSEDGQACFTWTWLGAAAVSTKKIELGTGLTCPILRYNPAIIAQATATLSSLAGGRTYLAVGTGEALNEYPVTCEWPEFSERQDMLEEAVRLIRELWTGEKITFEGNYYCTHKAKIYTLPKEDIPIYFSSLAPASARFAGYYGDGLLTVGDSHIKKYRQILEKFESGAKRAGKDVKNMPKAVELTVAYGERLEDSIENLQRYWAGSMIPALFLNKIYTPEMSAENGAVVGKDTIRQNACISSDPEEHIRYAQQFIDAGYTHIYFHYSGPDELGFIKDYGKQVLPHLRKTA